MHRRLAAGGVISQACERVCEDLTRLLDAIVVPANCVIVVGCDAVGRGALLKVRATAGLRGLAPHIDRERLTDRHELEHSPNGFVLRTVVALT